METGHALGRWVILHKDLAGEGPPDLPASIPGFEWSEVERRDLDNLARHGTRGRAHAQTLDAAGLALVARDTDGEVQHVICASLEDFHHPELPAPVRVAPGESFIYHVETFPPARGRGLARAVQATMLHRLLELGARKVWMHTIERQATVRRYCKEQGFTEVGWLLSAAYRTHFYWTVLGERSFFAVEPLFTAPGMFVFEDPRSDVSRLVTGLESVVDELERRGERIVLFGSGAAADDLLTLVPGLVPLLAGIVDSNPRAQGTVFATTGHTIGAPSAWAATGATHLLYGSKAFQDEMHEQHQAMGPAGSRGIRTYPAVEIVDA